MPLKERQTLRDPAEQAAALLLRVGLALLFLAAPALGVLSRRAFLVIAPLGMILIILSTLLERRALYTVSQTFPILSRPTGFAALVLIIWACLSLTWTSMPSQGLERLLKVLGTMAIAALAAHALPARMRATNLHLVPIGFGLAAVLVLLASLQGLLPFRVFGAEEQTLARVIAGLSLGVFAAMAWLMTKERPWSAALLAAVTVAGAALSDAEDSIAALVLSFTILGLALWRMRRAAMLLAVFMAGVVLMAPVIGVLLAAFADRIPMIDGQDAAVLKAWGATIMADPARLITGRGIESAARLRMFGDSTVVTPRGTLFEIWYELGIVGATGLAAGLASGALALRRLEGTVAPFALGALACAFAHACLGSGMLQIWWVTTLTLVAIAFTAVANGQYRSTRPRAMFMRQPVAPPVASRV